ARLAAVAPLLFGSGMSALAYQIAWMRALRLVFGASTAASAAVLAIFIGGLGAGGVILGRRADRPRHPPALSAPPQPRGAGSAALAHRPRARRLHPCRRRRRARPGRRDAAPARARGARPLDPDLPHGRDAAGGRARSRARH